MLIPNIMQGFGLEITMIAITAFLWMKSLRNRSTETLSEFNRLCSAFMLFLLVNVPVRILDFKLASWSPNLVFLINALFVAFETLTAYEWFIYFLTVQESKSLKNRRMRMLFLFPIVIMMVLLAVSYKTGWLFYVDRDGMYARGSLFFLQLLIPYLYVAVSFVSAILNYKKTSNRRTFAIVFSALFTSITASVLQILFSGSFVLAGFCFALILIYIEMFQYEITQIEKKREEKQRQDELARVRAEASDKAKTEFLFNMSHDIRTPMNAILGYTDIAMNHIGETERVRDSLGKIKTSAGHLLKLINDILEMSRIETDKLEIVKAPLNILEAADGVANMSQALADKNDITFQKSIGDLKNPYIYADELHTNQILINIISNAIKFTNPGGTIVFKIEQLGPASEGIARYRFTVSDNGIGMSDEFQKHIFESFSREQTSTVSKLEGTGLGLAIVKKIVDKVGGTIAVRSKLGEGSVFVVEIPFEVLDDEAVKAFTASQGVQTSIAELASFDGMRALLVEDNELNREIATEILEETGLVLDVAEDGAVAVEKVSEKGTGYYDFILMDIQMPVMDGYEATARIRRLPGGSELPIIALSANSFDEDVQKSLTAGMNAHASKPIDIETLLKIMREILSQKPNAG